MPLKKERQADPLLPQVTSALQLYCFQTDDFVLDSNLNCRPDTLLNTKVLIQGHLTQQGVGKSVQAPSISFSGLDIEPHFQPLKLLAPYKGKKNMTI